MKKLVLLSTVAFGLTTNAQLVPVDVLIPMSDGKFLAGDLYLPNGTDQFPTILIMTPYGKFMFESAGLPLGVGFDISTSDYAYLIVDWRCRFESIPACAAGSDNGVDGYDVVEWINVQSWSDGKIGMWGPSALGNIQFMTAKNKPPALDCCVPEVAGPHTAYAHYFQGGCVGVETLQTLDILFPGTAAPIVANPHYNFVWQFAEAGSMYPDSIEVPMLLIGGWFDKNIDQTIYLSDTLKDLSPAASFHKTLIGPWVHGGTGPANVGSAAQGEMTFTEAEDWNEIFALQFFDYHLRGIANGWPAQKRYTYFQMGDNIWNGSDVWPPAGTIYSTYYLHDDNSIQTSLPSSSTAELSFVYDPTDPSPTHGGKTLNLDMVQGPYDQVDSVEVRSDNLIFTTPILASDLNLKGKIRINLFVQSDQLDTDFAIRLTEVYPDATSMLLLDDIQRMRFRDGYTVADTSFMFPSIIYPITIELDDIANTFKAGNQLRVIITSSNYPMYNRNMNTGGAMYPAGNYDTLVGPLVATNTIQLNSVYPSGLELPVGFNSPAGVGNDQEISNGIEVWPNPTEGNFTVNNLEPGSVLEIYTLAGELIWSEHALSSTIQLNISNKSQGIYILCGQNVHSEKC